jgi:hypothetical protein
MLAACSYWDKHRRRDLLNLACGDTADEGRSFIPRRIDFKAMKSNT